jgi:hypothetical protein
VATDLDRVWQERRPVEYAAARPDPWTLVPLDWDKQAILPWHLPTALYYLTPWAWVRQYVRFGDWLAWRLWYASRPPLWRLEDGCRALDAWIIARAREAAR